MGLELGSPGSSSMIPVFGNPGALVAERTILKHKGEPRVGCAFWQRKAVKASKLFRAG